MFFLQFPLNGRFEQLHETGDGHDDVDVLLAQRIHDRGRLEGAQIDDCRATVERGEKAAHLLEHVGQREQGEEAERGGDDRYLPVYLGQVGDQVFVGKDDPFRIAGSAGSIDELRHIPGRGMRRFADRLRPLPAGTGGLPGAAT